MNDTTASKPAVPAGPQKMTPSEAFVETMAANGVTEIFGIMGSALHIHHTLSLQNGNI